MDRASQGFFKGTRCRIGSAGAAGFQGGARHCAKAAGGAVARCLESVARGVRPCGGEIIVIERSLPSSRGI